MRILLALALIFWPTIQEVTGHYNKGAVSGSTPTIAAHALNSNCGTVTCNLNITWPSGAVAVLYEIVWNTTDTLSATPKNCAGSSTCGASTDTLVSGQTCTVHSSTTICSYYICVSGLASGASNFTAVFNTLTGTAIMEAYALSGVPSSSCYDTGGTNTVASGSTGTVTTSGNISTANDLVLGLTLGAGTAVAGSGYTAVDNVGSKMAESSNSPPSSGSTTTTTWTGSSGTWVCVTDAIK